MIEFEKHSLHAVPLGLGILFKTGSLFLNIFSSNLFCDVLIIGFLIIGLFCLFMDQTLGEVV